MTHKIGTYWEKELEKVYVTSAETCFVICAHQGQPDRCNFYLEKGLSFLTEYFENI